METSKSDSFDLIREIFEILLTINIKNVSCTLKVLNTKHDFLVLIVLAINDTSLRRNLPGFLQTTTDTRFSDNSNVHHCT